MEKEIRKVCQEWDKSIEENDVEAMATYMSEDWVIVGSEGGIIKKESFLSSVEKGTLVHSLMDFEDLRVKVYRETAVVTSRGTSSGKWMDKPFSYYEWSSNTFIKDGDRWVCVLTMLTPARKN